ncbi:LADA_0D11210g1_1 [Lachancea dasiensis]|uniref:LADA_0D11210g1_1 n=1 Tax=Lachancea dasiensis TaxID=1072105 RepID=A0A1G4J7Z0_9SACH|nr:LADA_0D11210g1_1 [Lachancea dasiensis]
MKSLFGIKYPALSKDTGKSEDLFEHVKTGVDSVEGQDCESLKPLLILLDCQKRKSYLSWTDGNDMLLQTGNQTEVSPISRVALQGTLLKVVVKPEANEYDNVMVLDVANGVSPMSWKLGHTSLDLNGGAVTLLCRSVEAQSQLRLLYDMCMLARFEYMSLRKALTATVISTHGSRISDISTVLLAQHSYKDWCYISIDGEWVKAWCHVDRSPRNAGTHKGRRQIKFFKDDRSLTAKNLLCFIPACDEDKDLFLVEDQDPNLSESSPTDGFADLRFRDHLKAAHVDGASLESSMEALLSRLNTLRFVGDIYWPGSTASAPNGSKSPPISFSAGSLSPRKKRRSAVEAPSNEPSGASSHKRSKSGVSMSSVHHPDEGDYEFKTSEILIKPIPHSGVHHLESLIRCALPMMGCLSLYGRPVHFNNSRMDPESMLFGLPRLPVIDFFAAEEIPSLFEYTSTIAGGSEHLNRTIAAFKQFLAQRIADKGRQKLTFTTLSDMMQTGSDFSVFTSSSRSTSNSPLI